MSLKLDTSACLLFIILNVHPHSPNFLKHVLSMDIYPLVFVRKQQSFFVAHAMCLIFLSIYLDIISIYRYIYTAWPQNKTF